MPVVPFIPLIAAGVSAGTQLYTSHKASDTAKSAAATQAKSGEQALSFLKDINAQNQQTFQPWLQSGGWAATTLGGLMGQPTAAATSSPPATTIAKIPEGMDPRLGTRGYASTGRTSQNETDFNSDPTMPGQGNWANDRVAQLRERRMGQVMAPQVEAALDPTSAAAQNQSSYVRMRAPDGEEQDVPSAQVPHFTSLGATVVA